MSDDEMVDVGMEEEEEEEVTDLSNSDVTTKYQEAAKIANFTLDGVIQQCVPGARVFDLCKFGDTVIEARCSAVYQKKVKGEFIRKGIAFPTSVSVNECICHNSPVDGASDGGARTLAQGDMVKIDLAVHIDGYIASVAHTLKVGGSQAPTQGQEADVMLACYQAAEVAMGKMKPGATSTQVTEAVEQIAEAYGVKIIMGTTIQQMKRFIINGNKAIPLREEPEAKLEECTFEPNEVYSVDMAISSGEGKPREQDAVPTVFKRAVEKNYQLKMKASRNLLSAINSRFPTLPFSLRSLDDDKQHKLGLKECLAHELLHAYPVLYERQGDIVAHCKFTVLLLPSGPSKITGISLDTAAYSTDKQLPDDAQAVLAELAERTEKRKNKKNKKKKAAASST